MRAASISIFIGIVMYLFQNLDFGILVDKYGFPLVACAVMWVYFNRVVKKQDERNDKKDAAIAEKDKEVDGLRQEMLDEQKKQTEIAQRLLEEAQKANATVCKFSKD